MGSIQILLAALDERTIARIVAIDHEEARAGYALRSNTVQDFPTYSGIIGHYYAYHYMRCVARGGTLSQTDATAQAKRIIEREYQRRHGDIVMAYNDACYGTNGGLRAQLDIIAESLKLEATENYIREQFDRHVCPSSFADQVEIIRQFIQVYGAFLPPEVRNARPEQFARDYERLIRSYADALRNSSSLFRRLSG